MIVAGLYLAWLFLAIGYRPDHLSFILLITTCYFLTEGTHKFVHGFMFFIFFWMIFDSMRVFPSYEFNPVHIKEPYDFDLKWFGIEYLGKIITPNEYFLIHHNPFLDFVCGFIYLQWMPAPLTFAMYLFFTDRKYLLYFSLAFLFTNFIGIAIYYMYPAAPPWYVADYGFVESFDIPGSAAGLLRFDEIVGLDIFANIYNKSSNVFGAIPSLHSAYPIISLYYAYKKGLKWATVIFVIITLGTWFAAVYTIHHYVIDVILGIFCAIFALILFEKIVLKTSLRAYLDRLAAYIQK